MLMSCPTADAGRPGTRQAAVMLLVSRDNGGVDMGMYFKEDAMGCELKRGLFGQTVHRKSLKGGETAAWRTRDDN
jgi:hypothetical protein